MAKSSFVERNKAVREAWDKEKELVLEGKGTREWTPEQQKEILEKGRAYDETGKAFEGQHMKSAEMYPEYQGEPGNIQFLTRAEHLEAHDGNWKNATNWYYNPITKEKLDFGDGPFIPCETIRLTDAIVKPSVNTEAKEIATIAEPIKKSKVEETPKSESETILTPTKPRFEVKQTNGLVEKVFGAALDFLKRHPVLVALVGLATAAAGVVAKGESTSSDNGSSNDYNYTPLRSDAEPFDKNSDEVQANIVDTDVSVERASPKEHTVRPHGQHYMKNGERVWIEKSSYPRGGKKNE